MLDRMKFMALVAIAAASTATAQAPAKAAAKTTTKAASYKKDLPDSLTKLAKVSEKDAAVTALAKVPKGKISAVELEHENGKLQYSYEIKVPGKSGVEEVNVNALDGSVIGDVEHESPATEKKEAAAEAKKPAAKTKKPPM